ncbi:hypothetical protein D3C81_1496670 [compost metagenome]
MEQQVEEDNFAQAANVQQYAFPPAAGATERGAGPTEAEPVAQQFAGDRQQQQCNQLNPAKTVQGAVHVDLHNAEREDQRNGEVRLQTAHPQQWNRQDQRRLQCGHDQHITDAENQRIELEVLGHHQQRKKASAVQPRLTQAQQAQQHRQASADQGQQQTAQVQAALGDAEHGPAGEVDEDRGLHQPSGRGGWVIDVLQVQIQHRNGGNGEQQSDRQ